MGSKPGGLGCKPGGLGFKSSTIRSQRPKRAVLLASTLLGCASAMTIFDRAIHPAPVGDIPITEWPWTMSTRPAGATPELDCPLRALVAAYAARQNVVVVNATRETALKCFKRVDLVEALQ